MTKQKITSLIVSCLIALALLGGTIGIVCSKPNTDATTESANLTTNLFTTSGGLNRSAATALLQAVGYDKYSATKTAFTAHNIANRTTDNSGKSIIFKMGYSSGTSGTDLVWQATYLYDDYLTIWLDRNYTTSTWNASSVTVSYTSYASSTIQTYLNNTMFGTITQSNSTLQGIFATPRETGYQTISSGTTNDTSYYYNGSYTSKFDNMADGVADSYLWLPSHGEVMNNTTIEAETYSGQWALNSTDRAFSTTCYNSSSTASYCWLRSGSL